MELEKKKEELLNSENFCMLPWTHVHLWPDSTAHLCCVSDSTMPLGKYNGNMKSIYNSTRMKEVRVNMMNNRPSPECSRCYQLEKNKIG